jgi:hypothetical protein
MDSPEIIFYIVAALIYFLTRKKKKPQLPPIDSNQPSEQDESGEQQQPALSFEELLKELTGEKTARKPVPPQEPVEESVVEVVEERPIAFEARPRRELGEEMELLTSSFDDAAIKKTYQDSILASKEEKQMEPKKKTSRFEAYKISDKESLAGEIKAMLTDPEDVKKAVILHEVLARRF